MRPDRRGEPWFTALYAAHYPDVVRYGVRRLSDVDSSVELAQEVFEVAWRRRTEVPDYGLPWLYGVARRLLANHWRAQRSRPKTYPLTGVEAESSGGSAADLRADLRAALARLSDTDQEILCLVGWEQLSIAEAADVLGTSRTAAKVRLHRARKRLAAALAAPVPTAAPTPAPAHP
jgi:RNA polymerase sigma factor (sigma-70 family)